MNKSTQIEQSANMTGKTAKTVKKKKPSPRTVRKNEIAKYFDIKALNKNDVVQVIGMDRLEKFSSLKIAVLNIMLHPSACLASDNDIGKVAGCSGESVRKMRNEPGFEKLLYSLRRDAIKHYVPKILNAQIFNAIVLGQLESAKFLLEYIGDYTPRQKIEEDRFKGMRDKDINEEMMKKVGLQNVA